MFTFVSFLSAPLLAFPDAPSSVIGSLSTTGEMYVVFKSTKLPAGLVTLNICMLFMETKRPVKVEIYL